MLGAPAGVMAISAALALGACSKDDAGANEEDEAEESGDATGETGETGETDTTPPFDPIPARGGLELEYITFNQGIAIPVTQGESWVGPADRIGRLLHGRDTMIRGYWTYPDDWEEREIEGRLHLELPDGEEVVHSYVATVDRESYGGTLESTFWWGIPAEDIEEGTRFKVTLWETEAGHEDLSDPVAEVWPTSGYELAGFENIPMEMKITIVPIAYGGDCDSETYTPLADDGFLQRFIDNMHERNPVQSIDFTVREEGIDWPNQLSSISELHEPLQQMRIDDGAGPNEYYYGLLDACGGGIDGAAGIAAGIPDAAKGLAYQRVSAGIWLDGHNAAYETYVHEVGHTQGLRHIYCPAGDASGTDPSYPNETGEIMVWGFGIRSFQLKHPNTSKDYMTYCDPTWVSDWTWRKVTERIQILTSWDFEGEAGGDEQGAEPAGQVLIGLIMANGKQRWWTTVGDAPTQGAQADELLAPDVKVELMGPAGRVAEVDVRSETLDDGTLRVTVPLEQGLEGIERIEWDASSVHGSVGVDSLNEYTRNRRVHR
jgi:hypothetical protein